VKVTITKQHLEKAIEERGIDLTTHCVFAQAVKEILPERNTHEWGCGNASICIYNKGTFESADFQYVPATEEERKKLNKIVTEFDSWRYEQVRSLLPFTLEMDKVTAEDSRFF